jgi:HD-GYP domain-containing protein (c-di-GMP phosphodiesterase class II)
VMERHPLVGWEILREIDFLGEAKLVVRHHHERWDGAGYPDNLAGDVIPLAARVFAVADVLDALTTVRPYRQPSSLQEAREMIEESSGTQFDPEVVAAFLEIPPAQLDAIRLEVG